MLLRKKAKNGIANIDELKKFLNLTPKEESLLRDVVKIHPMKVSRHYLSLINPKDKNDPIRKMMIPSAEELDASGEYDTSGECENTKTLGLQHKYPQTALILSTNRCASYCRYCFRKRLVGLPTKEILNRFDDAVSYIREHKEINNVLISGGDPFILPTRVIKKFLEKLSEIKHLNFIRFGTKVPVAFPERIIKDKKLLKLLKKHSLKNRRIYVVTHFNHPREITPLSVEAINKFIGNDIIVNNQCVLLRGVNDNSKILAELMNKLAGIGVSSYYVFQCRPVKRVKNQFQVTLQEGIKIVEETKIELDGVSKRFRYVMSQKTGKIEILGKVGNEILLKYHQAKNPKNIGKIFKKKLNKKARWLDELK